MNTISIDNVFNYIPVGLRNQVADDDQIRSWSLQAARSLNFKHFQYVRDISFAVVENHQTVFPVDLKKIIKVKALKNSTLNESEVDILYNCCDIGDWELYPEGKTFAEACPIYHKLFVTSTFYKNCWEPVERVQNLADDYMCKIEFDGCDDVYSYDNQTGIAQFTFKSGVVAIVGYYNAKDANNNFLLPEEPIDLWQYMAAYVKARFFENQLVMGKQNQTTFYQMSRDEETKYRNSLRAKWTLMSSRSKNIEPIMSTKFLRYSQALLEYFSNYHNAG